MYSGHDWRVSVDHLEALGKINNGNKVWKTSQEY